MRNKFMNYKNQMQKQILFTEQYNKHLVLYHNIKYANKVICNSKLLKK